MFKKKNPVLRSIFKNANAHRAAMNFSVECPPSAPKVVEKIDEVPEQAYEFKENKSVKDDETESQTEGHYQLSPLLEKALQAELDLIMIKIWQQLPDQPANEAEKIVANRFKNKAGDELRDVLGLNVTKRILNVHNQLVVKVQFSELPRGKTINSLMKRFNIGRFVRTARPKNAFAAIMDNYKDFDRLCKNKELLLDGIKAITTSCYKFTKCPPQLRTKKTVKETDSPSENTDQQSSVLEEAKGAKSNIAVQKGEICKITTEKVIDTQKSREAKDVSVSSKQAASKKAQENKAEMEKEKKAQEIKAEMEKEKKDQETKAKMEKEKKDQEIKAEIEKEKKDQETKAKMEKEKKDQETKAEMEKEKKDQETKAEMEKEKKDQETKAKMEKEKKAQETKAEMEKEKKDQETKVKMEKEKKAQETKAEMDKEKNITKTPKIVKPNPKPMNSSSSVIAKSTSVSNATKTTVVVKTVPKMKSGLENKKTENSKDVKTIADKQLEKEIADEQEFENMIKNAIVLDEYIVSDED